MGYECISPREDLDNCGGCVSLGQGVSCERVAGVKKTECSHGRCINREYSICFIVCLRYLSPFLFSLFLDSCRSGWVLEKRSNTCIPRPRRNTYWLIDLLIWHLPLYNFSFFFLSFVILPSPAFLWIELFSLSSYIYYLSFVNPLFFELDSGCFRFYS